MGVSSGPLTQEAIHTIRAEVDRISATTLSNSPRLQCFLRYIVEQFLSGHAYRLKEYSIGVEVYQKSPDYDPKSDATVRGEASRLRSKLSRYYETEGIDAPVLITVPRGAYVPVFEFRSEPALPLPAETSVAQVPKQGKQPLRVAVACAIVTAFTLSIPLAIRSGSSGATRDISSLAVLPFRALVSQPSVGDEALGLAITDGLITRLGTSRDIIVRPTIDIREFTGSATEAVRIGKKLRVSAVIAGTFQRLGERIRLTARLVRTRDGKHLWSAEFEEKADDIFALPDIITQRLARALALGVPVARSRTAPSPEVFNLCSRGRYHMFRYTADDAGKSLKFYAVAAEKDPTCAAAFAGLAWAYIQHAEFGLMSNSVAWSKARAAAERAVKLDDSSFEAHVALGDVQFAFEYDWANAERSFKRALALNPHNSETMGAYRNFLTATGRLEEALLLSYRMRDLDPLSPRLNLVVASTLLTMRRYDEAIEAARNVLELAPEFPGTHALLAQAYYRKGMYDEWSQANARASELAQEPLSVRTAFLNAYRTGGVRAFWEQVLNLFLERSRHSRVSPLALAAVYTELGKTDQAFRYLEQSYIEREPSIVHLKTSPTFDRLRSDARFRALLQRMKL